jgi:hypothetical protein
VPDLCSGHVLFWVYNVGSGDNLIPDEYAAFGRDVIR